MALKLKRIKVRNDKSVDICIHDCFGTEYVLFPKQEKTIMVIKPKERKK